MKAALLSAWQTLKQVDPQTHWFYARSYLLGAAPWSKAPPEAEALAPFMEPAGRALDLGCGYGRHTLYLAAHGWQAVGLDLYPWVLSQARARARQLGLSARARFFQGGVLPMPAWAPPGFDLVLDVLGPASDLRGQDLDAYAHQLKGCLAPGGTVVIYTFLSPQEFEARQSSLRVQYEAADPVGRWLHLQPG